MSRAAHRRSRVPKRHTRPSSKQAVIEARLAGGALVGNNVATALDAARSDAA